MNHYVYQIVDPITEEFYFGVRSCECNPQKDSYMGSYCTWTPEDTNRLFKIVLCEFDTRKKANLCEKKLIQRHIHNPKSRNYHIPDTGFSTHGVPCSDEKKLKISKTKKGTLPWNTGKSRSEETKEKIREKLTGRTLPEEHKEKITKNASKYWLGKNHNDETKKKIGEWSKEWHKSNNNGFLGKKHTKENKEKMSKNRPKKPVLQYDLDGNFICEYESIKEAQETLNIHQVSNACSGKLKTCGGFKWEFK